MIKYGQFGRFKEVQLLLKFRSDRFAYESHSGFAVGGCEYISSCSLAFGSTRPRTTTSFK